MNPRVSIIVPTYNSEKFIKRAIDSILNQTFQDFEIIIIDDASMDKTVEIVKNYCEKDKRIKLFQLNENSGGPAKPFNVGIKNSSGEFVAFLESDDEWLSKKLEKQIEIFEKFSNVGLVSCWAYRVFEDGSKKFFKNYNGILSKDKWCLFWTKGGIISPSTIIVNRKIFDNVGVFDEKIKASTDLDFYMRVIKKYDFYFVTEYLVNYYETHESLSKKQFWIKWIPEIEYILKKYEADFEKCPKAKSNFLKTLGSCYLLQGEYLRARKYLLEAIKNNPVYLRLYLQFLISLIPNLYKKLLFLKRKIF